MFRNKIYYVFMFFLYPFIIFSLNKSNSYELTPYIGADCQLNKMRFKEGYGNNLFPKHYKQINIYSGVKINNDLSVEVGYTSEAVKNKYSTLKADDCCLGITVPARLSPAIFKSYIKIRGYHLSLIKTYHHNQWDHLRLLGGVGLGFLRAEAQRDTVSVGYPPIKGNVRHFKKDKAVLRLIVGSEYKFKNNLGARASLCFIQTSKMIIKAQPIAGRYTPIIRPRNSFIYSLGIFFEF